MKTYSPGDFIRIYVTLPDGRRSRRNGYYLGWMFCSSIIYLVVRHTKAKEKRKAIPVSFLSEETVKRLGGVAKGALREAGL